MTLYSTKKHGFLPFAEAPLQDSPRPAAGVLSIALSCLLLIYSGFFSPLPLLLFYALWFVRLLKNKALLFAPSFDAFLCLGFGLYCLVSFFWSDQPSSSLYSGAEFLSMLMATLIMARAASPSLLLRGVCLGFIPVMLVMFLFPEVQHFMGSKNQVGYFSEIGFLSSCLFLLKKNEHVLLRLFGLISFLLSGLGLIGSHSVTSVASLFLTFAMTAFLLWQKGLSSQKKVFLFSFFSFFVLGSLLFLSSVDWTSLFTHTTGKDLSLTGRTDLWNIGWDIGWQRPLLGDGYAAFWSPGNPKAEELWNAFYIYSRNGFHFHNIYIQAFVDTGLMGSLMLLLLVGLNIRESWKNINEAQASAEYVFLFCLSLMFLLRSFVEVDFLGPFNIGPFLFYAIYPMLKKHRKAKNVLCNEQAKP